MIDSKSIEINAECKIVISSTNIDLEDLKDIILTNEEKIYLQKIKNDKRKKEWLITRKIIQSELGSNAIIEYEESGRPYLKNYNEEISVSHSKEFVAIIIHSNKRVGLDIETISPRVLKVQHKYLTDEELAFFSEDKRLEYCSTLWAAKEALFKISPQQAFDFKKEIHIKPFILENEGSFTGEIHKNSTTKSYTIGYKTNDNNILVWAIDK